ncbi:ABC transporter substrate-binding protein [Labrys sp. (in: a-proteobacteria)]|uniref:ABC transporter substrate-binding protein n=1 Tax=Labrys sp. (in: a-proteobacteria) TaxID=1917972 RepID=UPI0039E6A679
MTTTHRKERTRPRRSWKGLLRAGVTAAALVAGGLAVFGTSQAFAAGNTITFAVESDFSRLDPHASRTWNTFKVVRHLFETFVEEDLTKGPDIAPKIVPALAESWDVSPDGKSYTFHLRKGVQFHDGTPWNAQAAKFNLDRMTDKNFKYFQPVSPGLMGWMWQDLAGYEVVDDYTFKINLKQPNAEFLRRMAAGGSGAPRMISPTAVETYGNDKIEQHPIGTGPFKFVERVVGEKLVIARNDNYWDPARKPKADQIIFRGIPEVATRELALVGGEVDVIGTPSPDSLDFLKQQGIQIISGQSPMIYVLWLNHKDEHFKDVRVRKAACMAINRDDMAKYQRKGLARPAYGVLNPGGPGFDPGYKDCNYDPEGAKKLLAEAGYPNGFTTRMDWTFGAGADVNTKGDAEWLQRDFEKIGIKASIEMFDNNTFWEMMSKGMREGTGLTSASWGESTFAWLDQMVTTTALPPNCCNSGYYNNPKIDTLLSEARGSASAEAMDKKLHEVRDAIATDMAFTSYYTADSVYAARPEVKGFVLAPQHWFDLTGITKQ